MRDKRFLNIILTISVGFLIGVVLFIIFTITSVGKAIDENIENKKEKIKPTPLVLEIKPIQEIENCTEEMVEDVETFSTMYSTCNLNIRLGANKESDIHKTVKPNTELKISDDFNMNGWGKVIIDNKEMYVCKKYLSKEKVKIKEVNNNSKLIGKFKITHYAGHSSTATGTTPTVGRTIAVDPRVIPYGSKVVINGHTYIAEDCGGAIKGNVIDIYVSSRDEAYQKGVYYTNVYWG